MDNFGKRLKKLRKDSGLTQSDLASSLGLAQTTIANYEKNIRTPNQEILSSLADLFNISLDFLVGRQTGSLDYNSENKTIKNQSLNLDIIKNDYFNYILDGDVKRAYNLLLDGIRWGLSLKDIYCQIIEPSLIKVGLMWEENKLSVGMEHYFSEATQRIMAQIHLQYPHKNNKKYSSLFLCANGERHNIGLKMISDLLEEDGWKIYFLGTDVPLDSILKIITNKNIDLLSISATMDYNINSIKTLISSIKSSKAGKDIKYMVGGRPFKKDPTLWKSVGAHGFALGCGDAVDIANKIIAKN